ncbi:MAG: NAD(P)H-dependent oxidoreductase [Nanohaloarchaea archaeon]|nr:NAD(P)H-dependent oxidoreductase [Candidatus Nanohaloarchaea archaeon]
MNILLIVGTTRDGRKTIRAAEAARNRFEQEGHEVEFFDLKQKEIPFLGNRTYIEEGQVPEDIQDLSNKVEETDCLLIITPEYNHSIPGALKNALDYLYPEYNDLPFAYITDSAGGFGGVRAMSHLNDITLALGGYPGPSLQISNISEVLSKTGEITEDDFEERLDSFVEDVESQVAKLG